MQTTNRGFSINITFLDTFWMRVDADPYSFNRIREHFTVFSKGAEYSQLFKNYIKVMNGGCLAPGERMWDGKICFFTGGNKLPIGHLQELIDFCSHNSINVHYKNYRHNLPVKDEAIDDNFLAGIKLRDYQIEATQAVVKNGLGIVKIATGGGKCVTGDTRIDVRILEGGCKFDVNIPIKILFSNYNIFQKAQVLTDEGYRKIENVFKVDKQNLIEIVMEDGKKLTASEDHRVKTNRGWKKLKDLLKTDKIMVYKNK